MSEPPHLFHVHRDYKYGGFDFGVSCAICELSIDEMNQLRSMLVCAIGTMEDMWRRENERRHPASQAAPADRAREGK